MRNPLIFLGIISFFVLSCGSKPSETSTVECNCQSLKESAEYVMNIPKKAKPEYVSTYKTLFAKCQAETLKEEACIEYQLLQSITDSTEFLIYERWTNQQGQIEHTKTPHLKEFGAATKGMFDTPPGKMIESYICSCDN